MTPFEEFLTFIRSGQPTENLPPEKLREFIKLKPDKMGVGFEEKWKSMRIDATRILAAHDEERRHREAIRVAWFGAWVAVAAAIGALAAAWYAKIQADSAALSARATILSTATPPALQAKPPKLSEPATAVIGSDKAPVPPKP